MPGKIYDQNMLRVEKADNQMQWVGLMNSIRQRATEIINKDLIFI